MKKGLQVTIFIGILFILLLSFDYIKVKFLNQKPVLYYSLKKDNGYIYTSFLYKLWICKNENGDYENHVGSKAEKYYCPVYKNEIIIIDKTKECTLMLEAFYEDDNYKYFIPCTDSMLIYIKINNSLEIKLIDALNEKKVTIEEVIEAGLEIIKEEKETH